jgi:integrase
MPLKLKPPRAGFSRYYRIRGTHLGVYVDRSSGTSIERVARTLLRKWEREIEAGVLAPDRGLLFSEAVTAYLNAGGDGTYLEKLLLHFQTATIGDIDQVAVDLAAVALYPNATPATRNRQVYTPVSAILNHARPDRLTRFRRPKEGPARTVWLEPDQFELLLTNLPAKLKPLAIFLVYSGCRLGEALALDWQTVNLQERVAVIPYTKNGDARAVHLTDRMMTELAAIDPKHGRVFGFGRRWSVAHAWKRGAVAAGLPWATPHVLRHTWATWMRRYAGVDALSLLATGAWRDLKSVRRYDHIKPSEEARRAEKLPGSR